MFKKDIMSAKFAEIKMCQQEGVQDDANPKLEQLAQCNNQQISSNNQGTNKLGLPDDDLYIAISARPIVVYKKKLEFAAPSFEERKKWSSEL